jgi:hypothetical protein
VSFVPLDLSDEESIAQVLMVVDNAIQYARAGQCSTAAA